MEAIIKDLIEKLIIPRFGNLDYQIIPKNVEGTNIKKYLLYYSNVPTNIDLDKLRKETKFLLRMLAFDKIEYASVGGKYFVFSCINYS